MILKSPVTPSPKRSIPRMSGDDPLELSSFLKTNMYSPHERG